MKRVLIILTVAALIFTCGCNSGNNGANQNTGVNQNNGANQNNGVNHNNGANQNNSTNQGNGGSPNTGTTPNSNEADLDAATKLVNKYADALCECDGSAIYKLIYPGLVANKNYSYEDINGDLTMDLVGNTLSGGYYIDSITNHSEEAIKSFAEQIKESDNVILNIEELKVVLINFVAKNEETVSIGIAIGKIEGKWYLLAAEGMH